MLITRLGQTGRKREESWPQSIDAPAVEWPKPRSPHMPEARRAVHDLRFVETRLSSTATPPGLNVERRMRTTRLTKSAPIGQLICRSVGSAFPTFGSRALPVIARDQRAAAYMLRRLVALEANDPMLNCSVIDTLISMAPQQ